jgi:hypothetical protein
MSEYECNSEYCFHYGEYEFCKCRRASKSRSAATVSQCRAYLKLKENEQNIDKELKILFGE